MSVYDRCEARWEAPVHRSYGGVLLRQRQDSNKANFLLICVSETNLVSECSEDMCLVKNGSNMYLVDDGAKELVIICDHVYFSHKNEWTQDCFLSPRAAGPWYKKQVTLIQEMNGQ